MTLKAIQDRIMFQTNNDVSDLGDFVPALNGYINQGYDALVYEYDGEHVPSEKYERLDSGSDVPKLPEYLHSAIADYATYLVYRNGNAIKQQRGNAFYSAFLEAIAVIKTGKNSGKRFINLYT